MEIRIDPPGLVTPVTWLSMPELLTVEEALHLSRWPESLLRWAVCEGWVLANDGDDGEWLIDRDSLHDSMLELVLIVNEVAQDDPSLLDDCDG